MFPATFFLSIAFLSDYNGYKVTIIVPLCLVESICDIGYCGSYAPSLIDLAPNYAGFLSAIVTDILPFIVDAELFGHLIKEVVHCCSI